MKSRAAIDTIIGYYYQFDQTILRLLNLSNPKDSITIEGIEDIDIDTVIESTAIQCKYYSKTDYNHSVIAKPIREMLSHFKSLKNENKPSIKYLLYGYYKNGHDKLELPLTIDILENTFLTYVQKGQKHLYHRELRITDVELNEFINLLKIDINAQEFGLQLKNIIEKLKEIFSCNDFEAENYYYNNSLKIIKNYAIEPDILKRKITKRKFLDQINNKIILFNKWFIEFKGLQNHFKILRKEYFTSLNTSPFERLFLIEINNAGYNRSEIKNLLLLISQKWSKVSKHEANPFCPYIYFEGMEAIELIKLKKELFSEGFLFIDGYDFHGADFNIKSFLKQANHSNNIKLKFINEKVIIEQIIAESSKTKEIYQFYYNNIFFKKDFNNVKHVKIQINELNHIKEII